jgi:hypothetical protein
MRWRDVHSDAPGASWVGVECRVTEGPPRPHLHMQAGAERFLKLMSGSRPLLWARVAPDYFGYWYLRDEEQHRSSAPVIPPITAATSRAFRGEPGSEQWYAAWCREFFRLLQASPRSPLHMGTWWMAPCAAELHEAGVWRHPVGKCPAIPPASHLDQVPTHRPHDYTAWDFHDDAAPLALHRVPAEDEGRLKSWRKSLREGHLPPVLVLWITGLERYVILDGHVRLLAALREDRTPPVMALMNVQEEPTTPDARRAQAISIEVAGHLVAARDIRPHTVRPFSLERANQLLVEAFDTRPRLVLATRAWQLQGGVGAWLDEVRTGLRSFACGHRVYSEMQADP